MTAQHLYFCKRRKNHNSALRSTVLKNRNNHKFDYGETYTQIPLTLTDVSLLFSIGAIALLVVAELSSPHYGLTNFTISRKRLRAAAVTASILFSITFAVRTIIIVTS